nr:hypothetical protein [Propionibacterium sp.]
MKNITNEQRTLLEALRERGRVDQVRWSEERGVASLLRGRLLGPEQARTVEEAVKAVLEEYGPLVGPPDVADSWRPSPLTGPRDARKIRAFQVFRDVPVYGATLLVFLDDQGGVSRLQSSFWREVKVTAEADLKEESVGEHVLGLLRRSPDAEKFEARWRREKGGDPWAREHFPLVTPPRRYWHPVDGAFHPAFLVWAHLPAEWIGVDGKPRSAILQSEVMLDAATGAVLWSEPTREGVYTDDGGDGLSTLTTGSAYVTRPLQIVHDEHGTHFLLNRLSTPVTRTSDFNGGTLSSTTAGTQLQNDANLSQDADGHWDATTTSCVEADRVAAQQPETDGHANAQAALDFYHGLGWDGFDDGGYGAACLVRIATHIGIDANAFFDKYTESLPGGGTKYHGYLGFYDGTCAGGAVDFDFMAGDPIIFGHEFQHAVTFFGAAKSTGEPGHLYGTSWLGAIREGFSDTFGCLRRGLYVNPAFFPDGATHAPALPFRRVEFPRSTATDGGDWYCDHYDDRGFGSTDKYFLSTMLSHAAFLAGEGGVHQRAARPAELIPVVGVGRERILEIFHYALTHFFDTIPTTLNGETLIEAGKLLLDAAEEVSGSTRTCEYVQLRRALYAVGLYPYDDAYVAQPYGGEACMLPWTIAWRFSQPYLGFPASWWRSPDLFINNGSGVEYNAEVGVENQVYARVRNIGDQTLTNVRVRFYFAPMGTGLPPGIAGWHPCQDAGGTDCVLDIPTLAGGDETIANPAAPPAASGVRWFLDPAYVVPGVDHFCLRARIECTAPNHDHDCPYEVQSNVSYSGDPADGATLGFQVANWVDPEPVGLDLRVTHTLPRGFAVRPKAGTPKELVLRPGKPQTLVWEVVPPARPGTVLAPPYDGRVEGKVAGKVEGRLIGELSDVKVGLRPLTPSRSVVTVHGHLAGRVDDKIVLDGQLSGQLDRATGALTGEFVGSVAGPRLKYRPSLALKVEGVLEPLRAVHFTQAVRGEPVGGVTLTFAPKR